MHGNIHTRTHSAQHLCVYMVRACTYTHIHNTHSHTHNHTRYKYKQILDFGPGYTIFHRMLHGACSMRLSIFSHACQVLSPCSWSPLLFFPMTLFYDFYCISLGQDRYLRKFRLSLHARASSHDTVSMEKKHANISTTKSPSGKAPAMNEILKDRVEKTRVPDVDQTSDLGRWCWSSPSETQRVRLGVLWYVFLQAWLQANCIRGKWRTRTRHTSV